MIWTIWNWYWSKLAQFKPTKAEGKAQDVAKVSDPSPGSAPVKSTRNGKAPFCVDNQLVESKQE